MARTYNGTTDVLRCSVGASNITGALSLCAWVKRGSNTTYDTILTEADASNINLSFQLADTDTLDLEVRGSESGEAASTATILTTDGWVFVCITKASGSATPRAHIYKPLSGSWTHENMSRTLGNPVSSSGGTIRLGQYSGTTNDNWIGDIEMIAVFAGKVLSDAQIEEMAFTRAGMLAMAPSGLWEFRQAAVGDGVRDLTGNGANESSRTGTTVATRSCPYYYSGARPLLVIVPAAADTTPPTPTIVSGPTLARVSAQATKDQTQVTWQSDENFTSYQLRVVSNASDTYTQGALLEQDENPSSGGTATTQYTATITDDEISAASPGDGAKLIKLFVRDAAGNWST